MICLNMEDNIMYRETKYNATGKQKNIKIKMAFYSQNILFSEYEK